MLVAEYPDRQADIDALLARHLAEVRAERAKAAGVALGRRAAATILAARRGDGYDFQGTYTFTDALGGSAARIAGYVLAHHFRPMRSHSWCRR